MSGQIVGEVIDASGRFRAAGLSPPAYRALIGIAEKANTKSREASVRWDHIRAAMYSGQRDDESGSLKAASLRSAERAVHELKRFGIIELVRRGFNNGQKSAAPIYRILPTVPADELAETHQTVPANGLAETHKAVSAKTATVSAKTVGASRQTNGGLDVSTDGSIDGGRARARGDERPPRYCSDHHPNGTTEPCIPCMLQGRALKAWQAEHEARERATRDERRRAREQCLRCAGTGQIEIPDDLVGWCPDCSSWKAHP